MTKSASTPLSVTWGTQGQKARLEVVQRVGTETIRVTVIIDPSYAAQSAAYAEVLTTDRTWNTLVTIPASVWHESVRFVQINGTNVRVTNATASVPKAVHELELDLFVKAAAILGV